MILLLYNMQNARDEWSKKRTERLDLINETIRRQGNAISTFKDVDNAMYEYSLDYRKKLRAIRKRTPIT